MKQPSATMLVIVGVSGDLSTRKLLPAIEKIAAAGALTEPFSILGITRQQLTAHDILTKLPNDAEYPYLQSHLSMYHMNMTDEDDYVGLKKYLEDYKKRHKSSQILFYLSIPPQVSQPVIEFLGTTGIAALSNTKLLLEKPFGTDLVTAKDLISHTKKYFSEEQIYRIDHYLAKEMAQNLIVFREGNSLFKKTWHNEYIEKIVITASEKIGIEGRAQFYEQTGALRDIVQSHLLQLLALTIMETPAYGHLEEVPSFRLSALKQLYATEPHDAVRGQYIGYRDEVEQQHSPVETMVRIELQSRDPKWHDVPFVLQTGKALSEKRTEIRVIYKKDSDYESNELVICLQPDEGIELHMWTKIPSYEWKIEKHGLKIAFRETYGNIPEAYEQVFLDAIHSKHTLFTTSAEVVESWRILEPIQQLWGLNGSKGITFYDPGSDIDSIGSN